MVKRQIINGALLGKHTGGNVSLTVFVEQEVQRSSTHFSAKTSDDQIVEVNLNEPLNTPVKGWIEVLGKPKSTYSIQTDEVSAAQLHGPIHSIDCCVLRKSNSRWFRPFSGAFRSFCSRKTKATKNSTKRHTTHWYCSCKVARTSSRQRRTKTNSYKHSCTS